MFSAECILAAALLTCPAERAVSSEAELWAQACRPQLIALALDAQLVDVQETPRYLQDAAELAGDLRTLQCRFRELAFAPLIEECERFPDRRTIDGFLAFNRDYARELRERLTLDTVQADPLRLAAEENDQLHYIWSLLRDARCFYYVPVRRQALQRLREVIGYEAFYSGAMPPYVPVWRLPALW